MPKEFLEQLVAIIERRKGASYQVQMNQIVKNNGIVLDGMVILKKGESIAPTIYVNEYYEAYTGGMELECIADQILKYFEEAKKNQKGIFDDSMFELQEMQDRIIYRLVNFEKNKKELEKVPYIPFLDLAITFHCLIRKEGTEIGTVRITKEMMEVWQFDINKIWEVAKRNTEVLFPFQIRSITEVIHEILKTEEGERTPLEKLELPNPRMFILSNKVGINGAATLLYENAIRVFADSCQCDFYILPSSIHEIILIPYQETLFKKDLFEMVCDVNRTQVPKEDILSDNIYFYNRKKGVCLA